MEKRCHKTYLLFCSPSPRFEAVCNFFILLDCVRHALFPVCRVPCMHCACGDFTLRFGCQCVACFVCTAWPAVCVVLTKSPPNSLERSPISLSHLLQCLSKSSMAQWLWFGPQYVFIGLREIGFIFLYMKTPFIIFLFCTLFFHRL